MRAVIFDLDGLLIDSEGAWRKATAEFFKRHGKEYTDAISEKIMGMGLREITELFKREYGFIGDTDELITERRSLMYEILFRDLVLMPGAKELITLLSSHKIPMAIATSGHAKDKTKEIGERLGIKKYIAAFISGDDFKKAKPAPDMYLTSAKMLGISPSNCLVFEDAPNGVVAGKAAGMTVYAVNKDSEMQEKLKKAGADKVFNSLKDVNMDTL
ncbi:MAG TPA: HAD family phosphatase [Candidatus Eisenbacteria bacterium]|nr:HAD family phosphatase [Candidatus Eisenbacteria bacterium]